MQEAQTHNDMRQILISLSETGRNGDKTNLRAILPFLSRRFRQNLHNPQSRPVSHLNEGEHDLLFEKAALLMATRSA